MSNNINQSSEKTKKPNKKSQRTKKKNEIITHLFKDKNGYLIFLKDHTDKVAGGRCLLNSQILQATTNYALCDIDISGAYTSIASALSYFFGNPVIQSFKRHKVTIREFLKYYDKTLLKRGFKIIVENRELLSFEQDLAVSFPNLRFAKTA